MRLDETGKEAGAPRVFGKCLEDRIGAEASLFESIARKGVQFIRVRAVEMPLSEYLHYEFKSYPISARYGQLVLVSDISNEPKDSGLFTASDFLLFDSHTVLVHRYNKSGEQDGAWLVDSRPHVQLYVQLAERFIASSIPLGVFSGGIFGLNSYLTPGLGSSDLPYLDGTYVLGTDPTQDNRFLRIRNALEDWSHALAVVNAHEVGHSVGLPHHDSSNLNIMRSWASTDWASNRSVRFSSLNRQRLNGNLGRVP